MKHSSTLLILAGMLAGSCSAVIEPCGPVPTENQIALQDMEMYAFIHYSLNTYTDQEWGYGNEALELFNPENLDVRQWVRICKASGMKGIIFTAKHHCGFCMWPSEYTDYSVKNTPWKDGKGDVVKELAEACREEGLKLGIYLSPWDRNHAEYGRDEYITYFRNQLEELMNNYGDVYEIWFDGANGGDGWYGGANERRRIDRTTYYQWPETYRLIREWQPDCIIWNDGGLRGDLRWVGTEAGFIGETNWSLLYKEGDVPYQMLHYGVEDGDAWVPGETNTSIRPGWFYHEYENGRVKDVKKLMETYYRSVGRNSTLILNFPIAPNGLIHPQDSIYGTEFYKMVQTIFKDNLAEKASISSSDTRSSRYGADKAIDGNTETYWAANDGVTSAQLTLEFPESVTFNRLQLSEYIALGQRVKKFSVETQNEDGSWTQQKDIISEEPARSMTTIGRKRILCFNDVTTKAVRINIEDSKACPLISEIGLYLAPSIEDSFAKTTEKKSANYVVVPMKSDAAVAPLLIELPQVQNVKEFRFLPAQDNKEGLPLNYRLLGSVDGKSWKTLSEGEFSNIVNNPIWQTVTFTPSNVKYLKMECTRITSGNEIRYSDLEAVTE